MFKTAMITSKKVQAEVTLPNSVFTGKVGVVVEAVSHSAAFIKIAFAEPVIDNGLANWFCYVAPRFCRFLAKDERVDFSKPVAIAEQTVNPF